VGGGPVMLMSAPIVVYGQWWNGVGSGENEISKGRAVESERRWNNGSTAGVLGKRYPACARAGDRAPAKSTAMILCARLLLPRSQLKAWSP
jgi:hypothetical protein